MDDFCCVESRRFRKECSIVGLNTSSAKGHAALSNTTAFDWKSDLSFCPTVQCVLRDDWFNIVPVGAANVAFSLAISVGETDETGDTGTNPQSISWLESHILSEEITSKSSSSSPKTNCNDAFVEGINVLAWKLHLLKPLERPMFLRARVMARSPNEVTYVRLILCLPRDQPQALRPVRTRHLFVKLGAVMTANS